MNLASYSDLKDKVVLIAGSCSGLGATLIRAFIDQQAKVAFISNDEENGQHLCLQLHDRPLFVPCDLSDLTELKACLSYVADTLGQIQVVINNIDIRIDNEGTKSVDYTGLVDKRLQPYYYLSRLMAVINQSSAGLLTGVASSQRGITSVINLNTSHLLPQVSVTEPPDHREQGPDHPLGEQQGMAANRIMPIGTMNMSADIILRSAIAGMTKTLARELGSCDIRVNNLVPGYVMTTKQKQIWLSPKMLEDCLHEQCLKHTVTELDIVQGALFLASNASRVITGQSLIIDSGRN